MKKVKLFIALMTMALALVLAVGPAHAGSLAVAVDLIGVKVCNFNMGYVGNFIHTGANSGRNSTTWGDSDTGSAAASANVSSSLNSNSTAVYVCDFESGPVAVNWGGGEDGDGCWPFGCFDQIAIAADLTMVKVSNFNAGMVWNEIDTFANSGGNWTFAGDSITGNANASATVATNLNSNSTEVKVLEEGTGPMALNLGSENGLAVALEADLVKVSNKNFGMVANCISTSANSGHNTTMFGNSGTGNATARSTVSSTVNSNSTYVGVADMASGPVAANIGGYDGGCDGQWIDGQCLLGGGPVAANIGTSGIAVSAEVDAVKVSNTNIGLVDNNVNTSANTGGNITTGCPTDPCEDPCDPCDGDQICGSNSDGGSETTSGTGNATATSTVENTVNSNETTVVIGGEAI